MKLDRNQGRGVPLRFLSGVFLLMWALNAMTPMFADDFFYVLHLGTEEPLQNFGELLDSISRFRRLHNGRIAAHFFAQLFLLLPDWVFPPVNAGMCTLLFYIIYRYIRQEDVRLTSLLLFSGFALVWLLLPGFGHCFLWLTGSCSYLWAITVVLAFLYPYFRAWMQGPTQVGTGLTATLRQIGGLCFAFLAGSWSENGSFSMLVAAFCFLALLFLRERKLPGQLLLRFAAACGGFLYLMLAPTELGRKNANASGRLFPALEALGLSDGVFLLALLAGLLGLGLLLLLWHRGWRKPFLVLALLAALAVLLLTGWQLPALLAGEQGLAECINALVSSTALSLVWLFGLYAVLLCWAAFLGIEDKSLLVALVFGLSALASVLVFLVAIYFPERAVCVATIYLTVADLLLLSAICRQKGPRPLLWSAALLALLFLPALLAGGADVKCVYEQARLRDEQIVQAQAEGADALMLEPYYAMGKYSAVWPREAADYYIGMENYYGIKSIQIRGAVEF